MYFEKLHMELRGKLNGLHTADIWYLCIDRFFVRGFTYNSEGVMFQELAMNFNAIKNGAPSPKIRFYVGHDGSMIRLAKGLGFGKIAPLRWPALGSEIVMEVSQWTRIHSRTYYSQLYFLVQRYGKYPRIT